MTDGVPSLLEPSQQRKEVRRRAMDDRRAQATLSLRGGVTARACDKVSGVVVWPAGCVAAENEGVVDALLRGAPTLAATRDDPRITAIDARPRGSEIRSAPLGWSRS